MRDRYVIGENFRNQIIQYLEFYQKTFNRPPTIDEIADHIGLSKSGTCFHLRKLKEQGKISYEHYHTRTIQLVKDPICDICQDAVATEQLNLCDECAGNL